MGWTYREPGGETKGPVETESLAAMLRDGRVSRNAFVDKDGGGWTYPAEHAELREAALFQQAAAETAAEANRTASTSLPDAIKIVAGLALFAGIAGTIAAFATDNLWLLPPALSSLLSSPFLYGFADIVLSLRKLCAK